MTFRFGDIKSLLNDKSDVLQNDVTTIKKRERERERARERERGGGRSAKEVIIFGKKVKTLAR